LNKPESAIENCQKALEVLATEDWAYWCLGDAKRQLSQAEAAVIQYEKAIALKSKNAFYYFQLGQTLREMKRYEAAMVQYQQAVKFDQIGDIAKQAQVHIEEMTNKIREQVQSQILKLKEKMSPK